MTKPKRPAAKSAPCVVLRGRLTDSQRAARLRTSCWTKPVLPVRASGNTPLPIPSCRPPSRERKIWSEKAKKMRAGSRILFASSAAQPSRRCSFSQDSHAWAPVGIPQTCADCDAFLAVEIFFVFCVIGGCVLRRVRREMFAHSLLCACRNSPN